MDIIIIVVVLGLIAFGIASQTNNTELENYVNDYVFPQTIFTNILEKYPHLSSLQLITVERGLRQYFHVCLHADKKMASMPSKVVDEAWHNFILFTKDYELFCKKALGRFLHHVPAEAMENKITAQIGIKVTWRICCVKEKIDVNSPKKLPLLFSIDSDLDIKDGFHYSLDCTKSKDNNYCAGSIGCTSCGGCGSDCGGCGGD